MVTAAVMTRGTVERHRNRYRIVGPRSLKLRLWLFYLQTCRRSVIRASRWTAEQLLFGSSQGLIARSLRHVVAGWLKTDLADLSQSFDTDLYLSQFALPARRKRAEVSPILHYRLIGWRELRTPNEAFDPVVYLHENPELARTSAPYLHYIRQGAKKMPPHPASEKHSEDAGAILVFSHARGGGATRYLSILEQDFADRGYSAQRLRPISGKPSTVIWDDAAGLAKFDLTLADDWSELALKARAAHVARILVNHVIDQSPDILARIKRLADGIGVPYDVVLHDYYMLCPRVDCVNGEGQFCGIAQATTCVSCISQDHSELGQIDAFAWRRMALNFLQDAATVIVPSHDLADRMSPHLSGVSLTVRPPEPDVGYPSEAVPDFVPGEPLRLATLGSLNVPKGAAVVLNLAATLRHFDKIKLTVLGPSTYDALLKSQGVTVTGRYRDDALHDLIRVRSPHAIFLPAIWPETWSFVLTEALKTGLPIIAFDIGAPAERLRRLKRGHLLPLDLAYRSNDLAKALEDLRQKWMRQA